MSADSPHANRDTLSSLQQRRLGDQFAAVVGANAFWTKRFAREGFTAERFAHEPLRTRSQLAELPLTRKADLVADAAAYPPYGSNLTVPLDQYVRLHQTSGTTGQPQVWLDTAASWDWFCRCWRTIYERAGVRAGQVVALPFSFGPFIGFWAAHDGAVAAGLRTLTLGGLSSEQRLREIARHRPQVVCCTPTYGLRLAEVASANAIDLPSLAVETLLVAGEPGGQIAGVRLALEAAWGARVIDHWGMSDVGSLGVEPHDDPGFLVLLEDECIAEILDPQGREVEVGGRGELVITNLGRHGMPVFRYATGDLVERAEPDSATGWTRLRGGILGRADDMLVIRGNNVFPSSVEAIVRESPEVVEFRLHVSTRRAMPHLRIELEPRPNLSPEVIAAVQSRIETACLDRLHFRAEVVVVASGSLPRFDLKARRLIREESP